MMDGNTLITMIGSLGFPIVLAAAWLISLQKQTITTD